MNGRRVKVLRRRWTVLRRAGQTSAGWPQLDGSPTLVFSEEFNGTGVDPTVWSMYDGPGHAGFGLRRLRRSPSTERATSS